MSKESDRRPDWMDPDFWRWAIEHCKASPTVLAKWFPEVANPSWSNRRERAAKLYDITFPTTNKGISAASPDEPPEGWPERAEEEYGVPQGSTTAEPLTTEEKIERDKTVRRLSKEATDSKAAYEELLHEDDVMTRILTAMERNIPALPPVRPARRKPKSAGTPESAVLLLSDWHIGEVVSAAETGGLAHYDFETYQERYDRLIDRVLDLCFGKLAGYDLPRLEVVMLGDMVSGDIHEELARSNEMTTDDCMMQGAHHMAGGLRALAAEFSEVRITGVYGNHGRHTKKPAYKRRHANWDYLFYHWLQLEMRDIEHVSFDIPQSFWHLLSIEGRECLMLHGDNIRSYRGIPWYGIERAVANLSQLIASQRKFFEYVFLGHFHNAGSLDRVTGELVLNGSAVGGSEFSIGALFTSSRPRQMLFGMHPERGRTWQFALDLGGAS